MDFSSLHSFAVIYDPYGLNNQCIVKTFTDLGQRVLCSDDFVSAPPSSEMIRGVFISSELSHVMKAQSKVRMVYVPTPEQLVLIGGDVISHAKAIASWRFDVVVQNSFELNEFAKTVFDTLNRFGIVEAPITASNCTLPPVPTDDTEAASDDGLHDDLLNYVDEDGVVIGDFESSPNDDQEIRGSYDEDLAIPDVSGFVLHRISIPYGSGPEITSQQFEDFCKNVYDKASSKRLRSVFAHNSSYYSRNYSEFNVRNRLIELGISNALGHLDHHRSRMILFRDSPYIFFDIQAGRGIYLHAGLLYGGMI